MKIKNFLIATKGTQGNYYSSITPDEIISLLQKKRNTYEDLIQKVEDIKPTLLENIHLNKALPKIKYYE